MAGARPIAVPAEGFRRIHVLRLSSLGDVVLTLPVVQALAEAWPEARLHYWTKEEYADLVAHDPRIAHVRRLERDARRIEDLVSMSAELEDADLIVDLHGSTRTRVLTFRQQAPVLRVRGERLLRARWVHARWSRPHALPHATARAAAALAPLGLRAGGPPQLALSPAAVARASEWFAARSGAAPWVALAPGARHATKCWPEEHWLALEEQLAADGVRRLVFSTAAERRAMPRLAARIESQPEAHWFAGPLADVAAWIARTALAVTHDSGLMHLAAATGRRVVALFGSTSPVLGFAPSGEGHAVLCRNLACQPCTLHGRERCPLGHHDCMRGIAPGAVHARVREMLREGAGSH